MSVGWTPYGVPAYEALREVVGAVKGGNALAPVSVLVPTDLCGVIARRVLARAVGGRPGVAGLSVLTVDRLAERIAAPVLCGVGRRSATSPVVAAAWRRALAEDAGVFAPVAAHPATVRALAGSYRELREVEEHGLAAIAGSGEPVASDLVRLYRCVAGLLTGGWYDATDLRRAAAAVLRGEPHRSRSPARCRTGTWPRCRYGLLQLMRSPGGFRLYSGADELWIRRMQAYLAEGLPAAEAARATLGEGTKHRERPRRQPRRSFLRLLGSRVTSMDAHRRPSYRAGDPRGTVQIHAGLSIPNML